MKSVGTGKSTKAMVGGGKKVGGIRTPFTDRVMTGKK